MQYGPDIDHLDASLSIYRMVLNRLPWVVDNSENQRIISNYTLELMYQLNPCFQLDDDKIGYERNYTVIMQAIIADIICIFLLMAVLSGSLTVGETSSSSGGDTPTEIPTFLSMAKAGSVEVQYEQFDTTKASGQAAYAALKLKAPELIDLYKSDAISKASTIGCYLNLFDDGTLSVGCCCTKPFRVIPFRKC